MSNLTVKIAQADPEVRDHIAAQARGMETLRKRAEIAEKIARDLSYENKRLRNLNDELKSPPPGVWGSLKEGRHDAD